MIKDKAQKKLAAKLCAAQGIVPFVEVLVRSPTGLEETPTDITDVDVLGLDLGKSGTMIRTIYDCKTASKLSAINRALWAGGLKSFIGADRAIIIQRRDAPYSHKLAANDLHVTIHSEQTFVQYAKSISSSFERDVTYLDNMDVWDSFIEMRRNFPAVSDLVWYATTQSAIETRGPKNIRAALSTLKKCGPELDPKKPAHRLLFGTVASAFLIGLSLSASSLIQIFQFSMTKDDFEKTLRYFVWEGKENYETRLSMKVAIDRARGETSSAGFDLPEWPRFVQIMRSFLDAPEALAELPYLMKEMAFRGVQSSRLDPDEHLRKMFLSNNRARQFIFATVSYLVQANHLPKEFSTQTELDINNLVTPSTAAP